MVSDFVIKVKHGWTVYKSDLFTAAVVFFVGMAGFGLGRLSILWPEKEPITITTPETRNTTSKETAEISDSIKNNASPDTRRKYVGSKSGAAYHFPWCPGALKIKEQNKVWFQTKEEAEKKGYKPAGNCPGL